MKTIKYLSLKYRESWICEYIEDEYKQFDGCWDKTKTLFFSCKKNSVKKGDKIIIEFKSKNALTSRWNVKRAWINGKLIWEDGKYK